MKKQLSGRLFCLFNNSDPKNLWQCFAAGMINFCRVLAAAYAGFSVSSYFSGDATREFPWLLMLILLPATLFPPFFRWYDKKKTSQL